MFKLVAICSGVFGLALALGGGEAVAQSTSNCMAMGPDMVHCDTMDMGPPAPQPAPPPAEPAAQGGGGNPGIYGLLPPNLQHGTLRNILGAIGDAFLVGSGREPTYAEQPVYSPSGAGTGQPVYSASECVGPIVAGVCHGAILPNQATHPVCHGEMLDGTCTGPMF
jgi:hypothetical protein